MNDFQMSHLAAQRRNSFEAEARHHHLASEAKRERSSRPTQRRRSRPFHLGFLLRREAV